MSLLKRIERYNEGISPQLKTIKWQALQENPFRFYRGTCHLFAEDFAGLYKTKSRLRVWNCGDAHLENFGSYKSENRQVYFDLNDFDEAFAGLPEQEITRFVTSFIIAANSIGAAHLKIHKAIHDLLQNYCGTVQQRKALMLESEVAHGEFKKFFGQMSSVNRDAFIAGRTRKEKGVLRLKTDAQRYLPLEEKQKLILFNSLAPLVDKNARFSQMVFEDAAIRVAGTGSLGQHRFCVLFYSRKKGKQYLLDIKQARPSCYGKSGHRFRNDAERIISIGRIMQFNSPAFMAPLKIDDHWYVVRELQPTADRISLADLNGDFTRLTEVATEMIKLMAYAHLRAGGNYGVSTADDLVRFSEKKQWTRDVAELAGTMALSNAKYYKSFCAKTRA